MIAQTTDKPKKTQFKIDVAVVAPTPRQVPHSVVGTCEMVHLKATGSVVKVVAASNICTSNPHQTRRGRLRAHTISEQRSSFAISAFNDRGPGEMLVRSNCMAEDEKLPPQHNMNMISIERHRKLRETS
ncbi:hypothetical protein HK097_001920 [Rhizophlyctis rosea]|uniref:Uncharacterized protein n=1 Tax=Rhizophlyctis rosea TaxID=64517 RepID=A0AAD5SMT1_9FUNG|nr:hypothetical protein HK097_001920 [Rhizophlyctis rosea]